MIAYTNSSYKENVIEHVKLINISILYPFALRTAETLWCFEFWLFWVQ